MIINSEHWQRPKQSQGKEIQHNVDQLFLDIEQRGDVALEALSQRFDGFSPTIIELKPAEQYPLEAELLTAIKNAAKRIETFARFQLKQLNSDEFTDDSGYFAQKVTPINSMAAYIPGGRFPLMSTALMTLIPARIAGCKQRIAFSPSDDPAILAAASIAGASQFVKMGGVQAIASAALGSQWNNAVDMIVGPGNAYVNAAKAYVQRFVKIDTLAGPSELLIVADDSAPIDWLVADLAAQAEHDPMALSILISWQENYLQQIIQRISENSHYQRLLNNQQIQLVQCQNNDQAVEFANRFAAEHLTIATKAVNPDQLQHYGSLFLGANSAVAFGDYCSGPNHTLPTLGYAQQRGGLSALDFLRVQTIQRISDAGVKSLAKIALPLAQSEGLTEHFNSIAVRIEK